MIKNLTLNVIESSKRAYNLAMASSTKRIKEKMTDIMLKFPELKNKGYIVTTLGLFAEKNNHPKWRIEDLKRNEEYDKKACFMLSCVKKGQNNFTGEPVLTDPELLYVM